MDKFLVAIGYYGEMPSTDTQCEGYRLEELGPEKVKQGKIYWMMMMDDELNSNVWFLL